MLLSSSSSSLFGVLLCCCCLVLFSGLQQNAVVLAQSNRPIVNTSYGPVMGLASSGYNVDMFLGIPFAVPPVGALRWTSPVPPAPWTTPYDASVLQPGCAQDCLLPGIMCPTATSEDCLYLDIYTPNTYDSSSNFPVMVFIAGGGFIQGAGGVLAYNGQYLSNLTDVVIVNANYRLGALGFFVSESLGGNYGIQDQRLVLQWVQSEISNFGGDPTQVTLFGESAGAMSVGWHMVSPLSKGLFSKAIVESNPFGLPYKTPEESYDDASHFAHYIGCDVSDLDCMRSATTASVIAASDKTQGFPDIFNITLDIALTWTPTVDGIELGEQPIAALQSGNFNNMPFLIGTNTDEGIMFIYLLFTSPLNSIEYVGIVTALFGLENLPTILSNYPGSLDIGGDENRATLSRLVTDYLFYCSSRRVAAAISAIQPNTYSYRFNHALSFDPWGSRYSFCIGEVCHGTELPFVFNSATSGNFEFTPQEEYLSQQIGAYWVNFAYTGNPNSGPVPVEAEWVTFNAQQYGAALLDIPISTEYAHNATICDFWDSIGYQSP